MTMTRSEFLTTLREWHTARTRLPGLLWKHHDQDDLAEIAEHDPETARLVKAIDDTNSARMCLIGELVDHTGAFLEEAEDADPDCRTDDDDDQV